MHTEVASIFRNKLNDEGVLGIFMKTVDPAFVEVAGYSGLDFVILDMEHGPISLMDMLNNIRAAQISGALPIVRVSSLSATAISQALDIGAVGVQIPQVCSAEQAKMAVRLAKYHPHGERGICRFVRAAKYSATPREQYFATSNENTIVIIQLEGTSAINALDEILLVEGIDILFIGPYDLSQSLGLPGQISHPTVINAMKNIIERAEKHGVITGVFADTPDLLVMWKDIGVKYLSYSVDVGVFYDACLSIRQHV